MSRRQRRKNQPSDTEITQTREQIAQKTKRALGILISVLIVGSLILMFRVGESMYPAWVIEHRKLILAMLISSTIIVALASPIIVEVNSNPRPLSGPGKNPKWSNWD